MTRALVSLILAAIGAGPIGSQTLAPSVAIFMDFDSKPGAVPLAVMETEASNLLKSSGISLDWQLVRQNRGDRMYANLVVLKFKGACRVDRSLQRGSDFGSVGEMHALGVTRVESGTVLPFTEVECDQVRRALAYLPRGAGDKEQQNALGLVLGRVVAHELYHILARTTAHAKQGLARATQSLQDLVSSAPLAFSDDVREAIQQAFK